MFIFFRLGHMQSKGYILFDLDGTLVDTLPDLCLAANHILDCLGMDRVEDAFLRDSVSGGGRSILATALGVEGGDSSIIDRFLPEFLSYYESHIACYSRVFDGVLETLEGLCDDGFVLAICTNKSQHMAEKLVSVLGIDHFFSAIAGGDRFSFRKPDGLHIRLLIDLIGGDLGSSVMIGDSIFDISAARCAEIPSIAVDFGYSDSCHLGADRVAFHFSEIPSLILELV